MKTAGTWVAVLASVLPLGACHESAPTASEDPYAARSVLQLDALDSGSVASHEAEPVVVVGRNSDEPEYLFHRVHDGILTDDGFWIANGGSNEIRFYSSDGSFRFALGRSGDGPGEFRSLARIFLLEPDSLLAFDGGGRVTEFGADRQVVRTFEAPWFEDGLQATEWVQLEARELAALVKTPRDPRQHIGETRREAVELVYMDAAGPSYRRTGIRLPDRWWTFEATETGFSAQSPPDGPSALLGTLGPDVVTTTSERPELSVWTIEELGAATPSGTADDFEQEHPESLAPRAIDQLVGTGDGGLWIGLHPAEEQTARRWIRIDRDSEVTARLDLPRTAWLMHARGDRLLVRAADSMGNQRVEVLAIR